jgi:hypothetical protein
MIAIEKALVHMNDTHPDEIDQDHGDGKLTEPSSFP